MNFLCFLVLFASASPVLSDMAYIAFSVDFEKSGEKFKEAYETITNFTNEANQPELLQFITPKDLLTFIPYLFDYTNESESRMLELLRNLTSSICEYKPFRLATHYFVVADGAIADIILAYREFESCLYEKSGASQMIIFCSVHIQHALRNAELRPELFGRVVLARFLSDPRIPYKWSCVNIKNSTVQLGNRVSMHLCEDPMDHICPEMATRQFACE
ncbi:hypothetical protein PRIPAC_86464 [Pristionchus pacificus]|uniref:Uncharacterized protein n=1 Tax=Pristionchus pacificus TaxID=54126 RepID=A0A2A6BKX3_PRIPA|nr:hypothetical protein PRIPAC_86464 [Pristionchus pacificus]|eukprot:PDM66559.1 hypothetical protein PRIPAC_47976 [Pristionchus pacificus]